MTSTPADRTVPTGEGLDVVIAGGHGQIALLLERRLTDAGHRVRGIIRNPDHAQDLAAAGAESIVLDLEDTSAEELAAAVRGADAVVFAAGGGPNSGAARKETVDKGAAILLADAAELAGVRRYVMVSAMGTDRADPTSDEVFQIYLRAKAAADADLQRRDLDWTIVRPGALTDAPGTGRVRLGASTGYGEVPRADVAHVLHAVLETPSSAGRVVELIGGETPVTEAVAAL